MSLKEVVETGQQIPEYRPSNLHSFVRMCFIVRNVSLCVHSFLIEIETFPFLSRMSTPL